MYNAVTFFPVSMGKVKSRVDIGHGPWKGLPLNSSKFHSFSYDLLLYEMSLHYCILLTYRGKGESKVPVENLFLSVAMILFSPGKFC